MESFILDLRRIFGGKVILSFLLLFFVIQLKSQNIEEQKKRVLKYTYLGVYLTSSVGFYQLWYKGYEQSSFHFFNDNKQWLQMDKVGHAYSTYTLTKLSAETFQWANYTPNQSALYASAVSFTFLTTIELMDAQSKKWGFSWGDIIANSSGISLYLLQELIIKKQSVLLKYSYSPSIYRELRPELLGENHIQAVFKDYNAQTYWASVNINDILSAFQPQWLNLAFGYSGKELIKASGIYISDKGEVYSPERQYFVSLDVNFEKIKTNKKWLKSAFKIINCLKMPFPTLEFTKRNSPQFHWLYY